MPKKTTTTKPKSPSGVDIVIDNLVANRDRIGAIAVAVQALPGLNLCSPTDPNEKGPSAHMSADLILADNNEERACPSIRTPLTIGMVTRFHGSMTARGPFG